MNEQTITIAGFPLTMRADSALAVDYRRVPQYGLNLGRLARVVAEKYPGEPILDVGANVGDSAAIIRSQCDSPIICIEGDRECMDLLRRNTDQLGSVRCLNAFLGDTTSGDVSRLDDLDLPDCKLLKVDCEGHDPKILRGAAGLLARAAPVLFVEYHRDLMRQADEDGLQMISALAAFGYEHAAVFTNEGAYIGAETLVSETRWMLLNAQRFAPYLDLAIFHERDTELAELFGASKSAR